MLSKTWCLGFKHSLQAELVGSCLYMGVPHVAEHGGQLVPVEGVDFEEELSAGHQCLTGIAGNGTIEQQGVVVGYEECERRLVVEDVRCHVGFFLLADIGGIADDE